MFLLRRFVRPGDADGNFLGISAITGSMARQSAVLDERVLDRAPDTTQPVVRRE